MTVEGEPAQSRGEVPVCPRIILGPTCPTLAPVPIAPPESPAAAWTNRVLRIHQPRESPLRLFLKEDKNDANF